MRHKDFCEPNDAEKYPWYADWKSTADAETDRAKEAYRKNEPYTFKSNIWGRVKNFLFDVFDGKCAYCESKVLHVSSGDVEHYAPKAKVTDDPEHSGYYWLAYDLRNLLPSCEKCNRAGAKMNQFPVVKFLTAHLHVGMFEEEVPKLLHPYFVDDPRKHLAFTPPDIERETFFGTVVGLTPEGKETVKICKLNREPLVERRKEQQRSYLNDIFVNANRIRLNEALSDVRSGKKEYSAALIVVAEAYGEYVRKSIFDSTAGEKE